MKFPAKLVIVLHEFFANICIALTYFEKYTCKTSHNLRTFIHAVLVAVLRSCSIGRCYYKSFRFNLMWRNELVSPNKISKDNVSTYLQLTDNFYVSAIHMFFYYQLGSGLSPQSCLYLFSSFFGLKVD